MEVIRPEIERVDVKPDMTVCLEPTKNTKALEDKKDLLNIPKQRSRKCKAPRKLTNKDEITPHTSSSEIHTAKKECPEKIKIPVSEITFEDCPFSDCPIVVQTTDFEHHKEICPFNPVANTQLFYCLFIGCKKRFKAKDDLLKHYKKCFFSIPGDLQKELQLEIAEKGFEIK